MQRVRTMVMAACVLAACKGGDAPGKDSAASQASEEKPPTAIPTSEAEFLAELAPLPEGAEAIEVRYRITPTTGDASLVGEMTTTLGVGGKRREQWELRAGPPDAQLRTTGLRIVTADRVWIANEGAPGELSANHLGALARAYLQLPEDGRAKIIESIHAWHRMLAEQRERDGDTRSEVLEVSCLQTRIAAQNVCMWEETGLLLRYEGSAFRIEAFSIDRKPQLRPDTFTLPTEAQGPVPAGGAEPNYEQVLRDIAEGSYGSVSALLLAPEALPELRPPTPTELAPGMPPPPPEER
jgi:hypothetical protein